MNKNTKPLVFGGVGILVLVLGVIVYQKSQVATPPPVKVENPGPSVKKVDLASQPEWVQKLVVTLTPGYSANGLKNFTFKVSGIPTGLVKSIQYVAVYETSNKGTQGAQSTADVNGALTFSRTIDLGTCSTKSCVRHDGVTSVDLELDFTTTSGDQPLWTKTLPL